MRKILGAAFVSLDGVVQDPAWTFQFESTDRDQFKFDEPLDQALFSFDPPEGRRQWPRL